MSDTSPATIINAIRQHLQEQGIPSFEPQGGPQAYTIYINPEGTHQARIHLLHDQSFSISGDKGHYRSKLPPQVGVTKIIQRQVGDWEDTESLGTLFVPLEHPDLLDITTKACKDILAGNKIGPTLDERMQQHGHPTYDES